MPVNYLHQTTIIRRERNPIIWICKIAIICVLVLVGVSLLVVGLAVADNMVFAIIGPGLFLIIAGIVAIVCIVKEHYKRTKGTGTEVTRKAPQVETVTQGTISRNKLSSKLRKSSGVVSPAPQYNPPAMPGFQQSSYSTVDEGLNSVT